MEHNVRLLPNCLVFTLIALGCSPQAAEESQAPGAGATSQGEAGSEGHSSADPRLHELCLALDRGRVDQARALYAQIAHEPGPERLLLAARLAALEGDEVQASRWIEEARALAPTDPRVFATAAEFHAAAGRLETADEEIQRGLKTVGACAELERARGIYLILIPGGATAGLALLQSAREHDPELPFLERALGQAHLLVGKERAREDDLAQALEHAKAAVEHDPLDIDARRFLAESLVSLLDYGPAIALYEQLLEEHVPVEIEAAQAYKNGAIAAMTMGARAEAVLFFLRARQLGMDVDALGSGVGVLRDAAREAAQAAWTTLEAGQLEQSDQHLVQALLYDPDIAQDLLARAGLALEREQLSAAEDLALQARLLDGKDLRARAYPVLAKVRQAVQSGDHALAKEILRSALELDPENSLLAAERAWVMAEESAARGDVAHALELCQAAFNFESEHLQSHALCATIQTERGLRELEAGQYAQASQLLREALNHDPERIETQQYLGVALFQLGDYAPAAQAFGAVLAIARAEDLELPDPVHIQLARSLYLAEKSSEARAVLEDYLAVSPTGKYVEETRQVLESLPQ